MREGVGYATARRWYAGGLLPVPACRAGGLVLVGDAAPAASGVTAVYARVSSGGQKPGLGRRVARVTVWAASRELPVGRVVTEVGSALNGRRGKFLGLLRDRRVETIGAEHVAGSPGSARGASGRCARRDAGCSWPVPPGSMTAWCGT